MKILLALAAVVLLCAGVLGTGVYAVLHEPVLVDPEVTVEVRPGASLKDLAASLETRGVVRSGLVLAALARWRGVDTQIRHGRHVFDGALTPDMVLDELASSPKPTIRITIPEGLRFDEIAELLEEQGVASAKDYHQAVCAPEFLARAGAAPEANCAEGYLFPDTYDLTPGMTAAAIADMQLRRFRQQLDERLDGAGVEGVPDRNRLITLASIIEKETARGEERTLVASVMHNRIRRGMKLQTDPTVIYGIIHAGQPWDGNITRRHLTDPTPYNTYTIPSLPPGPICNPGVAAVVAAIEPEESDYLYFVARGDGSHEFTRSYAEHQRAVRRYQLR